MPNEAPIEETPIWAAAKRFYEECGCNKSVVAICCGYIPTELSVLLYDTYGLALLDQEIWGRQQKPPLKVALMAFEWEMAKKGADVQGLVNEVRQFRRFWDDAKVQEMR